MIAFNLEWKHVYKYSELSYAVMDKITIPSWQTVFSNLPSDSGMGHWFWITANLSLIGDFNHLIYQKWLYLDYRLNYYQIPSTCINYPLSHYIHDMLEEDNLDWNNKPEIRILTENMIGDLIKTDLYIKYIAYVQPRVQTRESKN